MRDHWPFKYRPELFERAHAVFERYGIVAVCIGYFIGSLRGPIPVAAGVAGMPYVQFHIANVLAAVIWALTVIAPGAILHQSFGPDDPILLLASLIMPVVILGIAMGIIVLRRVLNRSQPTAPQASVQSSLDFK
jgi:membrane-associated protein